MNIGSPKMLYTLGKRNQPKLIRRIRKQLLKLNAVQISNSLTFWPVGHNSLLDHCHSRGWRVAKRTNI